MKKINLTSIITSLIILLGLTILLIFKINLTQWQILAITSGSMRPDIPLGSLVVVQRVEEYKVNNLVAYKTKNQIITHRIIKVNPDGNFTTQGDANDNPDQQLVKPKQVLGKVAFILPRLGRLLIFLKTKTGIILLIIVPSTIIIWEELKRIIQVIRSFNLKS